ncbi:MAG: hypothetical protein NC204_05495 [Candidatus Amulumruptor caecigallinarius]|nr:hypothetical protein [Candidatus Amulumruptor caecigallinarius]
MTFSVLSAVAVVIILAVMVMILLSVKRLFTTDFNSEYVKTEELRREVVSEDDVITENSVFHSLVKNQVRESSPSEGVAAENEKRLDLVE